MSDIKQHVPCLETCQRMKELGWKTETMWYWEDRTSNGIPPYIVHDSQPDPSLPRAPLLSEILEALPPYLKYKEDFDEDGYADDFYALVMRFDGASTYVRYETRREGFMHPACTCTNNPAEAAALFWIKLREEGVISSNEKE